MKELVGLERAAIRDGERSGGEGKEKCRRIPGLHSVRVHRTVHVHRSSRSAVERTSTKHKIETGSALG
jgi:hypothetical protein